MTLDEAAEWKVPPWELAGGSPLLWHLRYRAYRRVRIEADQRRQRELN